MLANSPNNMFPLIRYTYFYYYKTYNNKVINMESNIEILNRLKFLGKLQKGEKISVSKMQVQPDGWITSIIRTFFSNDNRETTLNFINCVINRSFEILSEYILSNKQFEFNQTHNIVKDILGARESLKNLKYTYNGDVMFCCNIETVIQSIDAKLQEVYDMHPDVFLTENKEKDTDTSSTIEDSF
jgi:hypothetical protein